MGRAKSFTEMGQLNLYLPKWQIDELERLAKLERTTRSKLAHRAIAKLINPTPPKETAKPVLEEKPMQAKPEWETPTELIDTSDIDNILKF